MAFLTPAACRPLLAATIIAGGWLGVMAADSCGQEADAVVRSMMFSNCQVRESVDGDWHLRIVGDLPRGPGLYLVIWGSDGHQVWQGEVPYGTYPDTAPFTQTIAADGVADDYIIRVIGQQDNLTGLQLPLTDLALEVYSGTYFAIGYSRPGERRRVALQVGPGTERLVMAGWKGGPRLLDADGNLIAGADAVVAEDAAERYFGANYVELQPQVAPGHTYWIEPAGAFYLVFKETVYVTFDPARWFQPRTTWLPAAASWWEGLAE